MNMQNIIQLTDKAAEKMHSLIKQAEQDPSAIAAKQIDAPGKPVIGLRVGVTTQGCSGQSYFVQYATEKKKLEDEIETKGVRVFIEPSAVMFLIGSTMDWQEGRFSSEFIFSNPNEKGRCGCGESFHV